MCLCMCVVDIFIYAFGDVVSVCIDMYVCIIACMYAHINISCYVDYDLLYMLSL